MFSMNGAVVRIRKRWVSFSDEFLRRHFSKSSRFRELYDSVDLVDGS
jgi:hypothetical protein